MQRNPNSLRTDLLIDMDDDGIATAEIWLGHDGGEKLTEDDAAALLREREEAGHCSGCEVWLQ